MKELLHLLSKAEQLRQAIQPFALATVVKINGSTYRRPGARMLIDPDGITHGTISGGCLLQFARRPGDGDGPIAIVDDVDFPAARFMRMVGGRFLVALDSGQVHVLDTRNIDAGAKSLAANANGSICSSRLRTNWWAMRIRPLSSRIA